MSTTEREMTTMAGRGDRRHDENGRNGNNAAEPREAGTPEERYRSLEESSRSWHRRAEKALDKARRASRRRTTA